MIKSVNIYFKPPSKKETPTAFLPQLPLEIAVVKFCQTKKNSPLPKINSVPTPKANLTPTAEEEVREVKSDLWDQILSLVHAKDTRIEALLRAARPLGFDGDTFKLGVYYSFHKERLESQAIRQVLEEVVTQVCGNPVRVSYSLTERISDPTETLTPSVDGDIIEAAKEIFG